MLADLHSSGSDSGVLPSSGTSGRRWVAVETALSCARRGWPVHPLAPMRKTPAANCSECRQDRHSYQDCPCVPSGRWCHGFHAATLKPRRIEQWWAREPRFGVGVSCGPAGLVVIDVDAHQTPLPARDRLLPGIPIAESVPLDGLRHGFHSLALLAALREETDPAGDSSTLRVRTPSGGMHIWYSVRPGDAWVCSVGASPNRALAWQVDVRAHGGYIVAPGTVTEAGTYRVLDGERLPAPLPQWLANELLRTGHRPVPPSQRRAETVPPRGREAVLAAGGGRGPAAVMGSLLEAVIACASAAEGAGFSDKLNRAAFTAGGLVAAGRMTALEAERALTDAAVYARPGKERQAARIIRSGMSAGAQRPLHPGERT